MGSQACKSKYVLILHVLGVNALGAEGCDPTKSEIEMMQAKFETFTGWALSIFIS